MVPGIKSETSLIPNPTPCHLTLVWGPLPMNFVFDKRKGKRKRITRSARWNSTPCPQSCWLPKNHLTYLLSLSHPEIIHLFFYTKSYLWPKGIKRTAIYFSIAIKMKQPNLAYSENTHKTEITHPRAISTSFNSPTLHFIVHFFQRNDHNQKINESSEI